MSHRLELRAADFERCTAGRRRGTTGQEGGGEDERTNERPNERTNEWKGTNERTNEWNGTNERTNARSPTRSLRHGGAVVRREPNERTERTNARSLAHPIASPRSCVASTASTFPAHHSTPVASPGRSAARRWRRGGVGSGAAAGSSSSSRPRAAAAPVTAAAPTSAQ